jgi:hypothetical protein
MKALPKLMKNSVLSIEIVSEEMPGFTICISGSTTWPSTARLDKQAKTLRLFDYEGKIIHEGPMWFSGDVLPYFGLVFIGVTESRVDFKTKSQTLVAKMRAINLDAHENLHGDNWGYDE